MIDLKKLSPHYMPRSLSVRVSVGDRLFLNQKAGHTYRYYDVGSMTKIMVTALLCAILVENKSLQIDRTVKYYLPYFWGSGVGSIKVKDLLRHLSGLVDHREFFRSIRDSYELKNVFRRERVRKAKTCLYSDLDFMLLGWIVEELMALPIDEAAEQFIFGPFKMRDTFFNPKKYFKSVKNFAPTEVSKFRGVVKGVVFDDNTWCVGGVSGHAGLFSTAQDVDLWGRNVLNIYKGKRGIVKPKTLRHFVGRAVTKAQGDWGLGFVLPSRPVSTGGTKISSKAFGHTGFVGTSIWVDPARDAVVTVLSDRTYPNRNDNRFKEMRIKIHDAIWEMIDHG